jgi:hypothetical protein
MSDLYMIQSLNIKAFFWFLGAFEYKREEIYF